MLVLSKKSFEESRTIWMRIRVVLLSEKTAFLSLAERRNEKTNSTVVEIVVCLITINFKHSVNPITKEFIQFGECMYSKSVYTCIGFYSI